MNFRNISAWSIRNPIPAVLLFVMLTFVARPAAVWLGTPLAVGLSALSVTAFVMWHGAKSGNAHAG